MVRLYDRAGPSTRRRGLTPTRPIDPAIDDCIRLRVLRIYDRLGQKTAIQFVDYVLEKLPFHVLRIQTDNGSEFQALFHWHVLDRGIDHVYIRPATPRLNGKVERSYRIDVEEFYRMLDGVVVDEAKVFTTKLQEWEDFYNFDRPHGALGGQTPYERLRQKVDGSSVSGHRQLHTSNRPWEACRRRPSAIWLRAELCVQRNSTRVIAPHRSRDSRRHSWGRPDRARTTRGNG